ncbi:snapalysin family zinc-dependent metalloprotease [Nocardiopsis sp. RSe5-2]|uniref:Extracellular small neutral protease n=1 Tax=Nocardiopsis endophytica TaxID=3018445 RepID=A0ABT4UAM2_9ACTN|nr:snapalysin family zinc-dependent metalloprotease [Nocardiopsis endophytica]MDA2813968.1 snapalysin family zinc-dependent metalloprotease [Nocardiopsis endophytica]
MTRRVSPLTLVIATVAALIGGGAVAAPAAASPAPAPGGDAAVQQTVLYYDASGAAEFQDAVAAGAAEWNAAVDNVELVPAEPGRRAEITIVATDGWPMATLGPVRPGGSATVWFGRQAVQEGYDTVRIASHELGHNLGLPDVKPGPCSSLMSGSTGGVGCTNATPNDQERSRVEQLYGGGAAAQTPAAGTVLVDRP